MATAPAALTAPARRGYCKTPHSYFKSLPRVLSPVEHVIWGNILDDTVGAYPAREWTEAKLAYFASLANCTEDAAQKAVKRMEVELQILRSRRRGKGKEYQVVPENLDRLPERPARHFGAAALERVRARFRKPAGQAAHLAESDEPVPAEDSDRDRGHTIKVVEMPVDTVENSEAEAPPKLGAPARPCPHCGRAPGDAGFAPSSPSRGATKPVTDRTPDVENGCDQPGAGEGVPPRVSELEAFAVTTITPLLCSPPDHRAVLRAVKALGPAPVQMLQNRITQRLDLFRSPKASWGALAMLAEDVAKAYHALKRLRGRAAPVELSGHWKSATEIRRLYADPETGEHVRREILIMWPELKQSGDRPRTRLADGFAEFLRGRRKP